MIELENFVYLIPSVRGVMIQKEQVQPYLWGILSNHND